MSSHYTAEEIETQYMASMGKPLGKCFSALCQEVNRLSLKWAYYVALFGTKPSRVDLLNKVAPLFFLIIGNSLWEETLLHIARLTDSTKVAGRNNLTIKMLPDLIDDTQFKQLVIKLIETTETSVSFCRDWRNRRIAHCDLYLSLKDDMVAPLEEANRKKVNDALHSLFNLLNTVEKQFTGSETQFNAFFDENTLHGDAISLLYVLDDGLKADEDRLERMRCGEYDTEPRDL